MTDTTATTAPYTLLLMRMEPGCGAVVVWRTTVRARDLAQARRLAWQAAGQRQPRTRRVTDGTGTAEVRHYRGGAWLYANVAPWAC